MKRGNQILSLSLSLHDSYKFLTRETKLYERETTSHRLNNNQEKLYATETANKNTLDGKW